MTKSNQHWIIISVLCILFIGLFIFGFVTVSQKNNQISQLTAERDALTQNNSQLDTELTSVKASLDTNTQAFNVHKELLKQYVSYDKVISQDVDAVVTAAQSFYDETSSDYDTNKILVNRYEQQLATFKKHITEYTQLLKDNKNSFEEIGIDTDVTIASLENSMPLYDDELAKMNKYLDTIK